MAEMFQIDNLEVEKRILSGIQATIRAGTAPHATGHRLWPLILAEVNQSRKAVRCNVLKATSSLQRFECFRIFHEL